MKKMKRSTWVCVALFLYVTATVAYLLPRNTEMSDLEKYIMFGASYLIIFLLWLALKKKEQLQRRRRESQQQNKLNK